MRKVVQGARNGVRKGVIIALTKETPPYVLLSFYVRWLYSIHFDDYPLRPFNSIEPLLVSIHGASSAASAEGACDAPVAEALQAVAQLI